jgi:hypothetical protein
MSNQFVIAQLCSALKQWVPVDFLPQSDGHLSTLLFQMSVGKLEKSMAAAQTVYHNKLFGSR